MPSLLRLALPVLVGLTALFAAVSPASAATPARFPVQSLGNRGPDVRAVQVLLYAHGYRSTLDGVLGSSTQTAIRAFQADRGLPGDGVVTAATWAALLIDVRPGDTGPAVAVLQQELAAKRGSDVTPDGRYDATTRAAVVGLQRSARATTDGVVTTTVWRRLIGAYDVPVFDGHRLCDYSVGNGKANWATGETIAQLSDAAAAFAALGHGGVAVGDASLARGGDIPLHATHEVGLDVDIRAVRKAGDQCRWGVTWRWSSYDRAATRELIDAIRAAAPGHVQLIYFNDPVLIREGLTTWFAGHDDHLHVRYCEPGYPLAMYRCR